MGLQQDKSQEREREERERELRAILEVRYQELNGKVMRGLHSIRANGIQCRSENILGMNFEEVIIQTDVDVIITQIMAEIRRRISDAIKRLDSGTYGVCNDCGEEISTKRLQALPFAIRCRDCEETREKSQRKKRKKYENHLCFPFSF